MEIIELPKALKSESAAIGSVFINPEIFEECHAVVSSGDFADDINKIVWSAFVELHTLKRSIDIVTVGEITGKQGVETSLLYKYISECPNSFNAKSYAEEIRDKARRRKQVLIANQIVKGAFNGGVNIADVVGKLFGTSDVQRSSERLANGLSEYFDYISERFKNPREVWGIPSNFYKELDKSTGGLHKGHVVMLSGAPGAGKSILASAIILYSALKGTSWAIYSLEMDKADLINRWVGMLTGMSEDKLSSGMFDAGKWDVITNAIETLESLPIYINDMPAMTTTQISADLSQIQSVMEIDAVCVDYLELLGDTAESANDATAKKSRRFREICREKKMAGLIIQSMTKEGIGAATGGIAQGGSKKSFVSSQSAIIGVRGPADVGHDADTIFMLVVDPEDTTGRTIAALPVKKRHGNGGKKPIRFKWHETAPLLIPADKEIYFTDKG